MAIKKKKISVLPLADTFTGLYTLGVNSLNRSVKVGLEFLKTAADKATSAATNADNAASSATSAATSANTAATNANAKATLADQKATAANSAAAAANTAKSNADTATGAATDAAGKATTAANVANTAAGRVETSISNANTAATNANAKATLADQKATAAGSAAAAANTAKSNADTATGAANDAAGRATTEAGKATTAATAANAAAGRVETSITNATTAANNADAKAALADQKATLANSAATAANAATGWAETSISNANTAATNANAKATLADQKAMVADSAAAAANTAKSNADTATGAANDAVAAVNAALSGAVATQSKNGLMSSVDKIKLDGMDPTAQTSSEPLGSITWMAVNDTPDGYEPLWSGHNITRAQYPDFFSRLVDTNKIPTVTNTTFNSQASTYGSCASFVKIDTNTLRLPKLTTYMRAGTTAGGVLNDQIVNIKGVINQAAHGSQVVMSGSGAFSSVSTGNPGNAQGGGATNNVTFDASKSTGGGVVRTGSEVQPKSFVSRPFLKCADVSRTLTEEQTGEIRNLYANKANVDLENVRLVKSLASSGYYQAPDGLMLQWGSGTGSSATTIMFPTTFKAVYSVFTTHRTAQNEGALITACPYEVSTALFIVKSRWGNAGSTGDSGHKFDWLAIGRWK